MEADSACTDIVPEKDIKNKYNITPYMCSTLPESVYSNPFCVKGIWEPKYPSYYTFECRLNTFESWPIQIVQRPHELAKLGFFYDKDGDKVRCFFCGVGVYRWEEHDIVNIEHSKWSPNCKYMQMTCKI